MESDINTKISQLFELLVSTQPSKKVPLQILNPLFSTINTVISLLGGDENKKLPDEMMKMTYDFLTELKDTLEKVSNQGTGLFDQLKNLLPGSNLRHLQAMVPKLQDIHDKIVHRLAKPNTGILENKTNKRNLQDLNNGNDDEETFLGEIGYKKVKRAPENESTSTRANNEKSPFFVKFFCDPEIQEYLPQENLYKCPGPFGQKEEVQMIFRREEFVGLPPEVVLRLSKEHASITAQRENGKLVYELMDISVNGTFLLGNSVRKEIENPPKKLKSRQKYAIKHGDRIALLMKKAKYPPQALLGFEFSETLDF